MRSLISQVTTPILKAQPVAIKALVVAWAALLGSALAWETPDAPGFDHEDNQSSTSHTPLDSGDLSGGDQSEADAGQALQMPQTTYHPRESEGATETSATHLPTAEEQQRAKQIQLERRKEREARGKKWEQFSEE